MEASWSGGATPSELERSLEAREQETEVAQLESEMAGRQGRHHGHAVRRVLRVHGHRQRPVPGRWWLRR